jgi:hypothetical protein
MRLTLDHHPDRVSTPLTDFVHRRRPGPNSVTSSVEPPLPTPGPLGFPVWSVTYRSHTLVFASTHELRHAIDVLSSRLLPTSRKLGEETGAVNSHWLSRLHRDWKPYASRSRLVTLLRQALDDATR